MRRKIVQSHVLIIDALGFANRIRTADQAELLRLWYEIDDQYAAFVGQLPNRLVLRFGRRRFLGTREFETLRLNDMFIVYSRRDMPEAGLRYLIAASLLYQQMLVLKFIPRGGLGFGDIAAGNGLLIGGGFIDAYERAERRGPRAKGICAVEISPRLMALLRRSAKALKLVCFYDGRFFLHPYSIRDPSLGAFTADRVISCLADAGTNRLKLSATEKFLAGFEDYGAAAEPGSRSRSFFLKDEHR